MYPEKDAERKQSPRAEGSGEGKCPDGDLLSAYYDGEVASPWKEQIREHVARCDRCRALLKGYSSLSLALNKADETSSSVEASRERIHRSLGHQVTPFREPAFWRRRISLPLPAAAALLILILGGGLLVSRIPDSALTPETSEPSVLAVDQSQDLEWEDQRLEQLLEALEAEDEFVHQVEWEIPLEEPLYIDGTSQLIRQVDFQAGGTR